MWPSVCDGCVRDVAIQIFVRLTRTASARTASRMSKHDHEEREALQSETSFNGCDFRCSKGTRRPAAAVGRRSTAATTQFYEVTHARREYLRTLRRGHLLCNCACDPGKNGFSRPGVPRSPRRKKGYYCSTYSANARCSLLRNVALFSTKKFQTDI